ncbi:UNVERIFIED_CONTAM: hypothetical protein FKN15_077270 [Acipenser sinensis]
MTVAQAMTNGYGINTTPTRILVRAAYNSTESQPQVIQTVPMAVLRSTTFYKQRWMVMMVDTAVTCPTDYKLDVGPQLITVRISVGADGGYYKSHVFDNTYVISYSIEPMLEHTWQDGPEKTKYTVLHPITTPFMPRPPVVTNNTVPKARVFNVTLGTFLPALLVSALLRLVLRSGALCSASALGTLGARTLTLDASALRRSVHAPRHSALDARCTHLDARRLGASTLGAHTSTLGASMPRRSVHAPRRSALRRFPYNSVDATYEVISSLGIRSRLDLTLKDIGTMVVVADFSLSCSFPTKMIDCFTNGTMAALAVKVESVPSLSPSQLTLRDPSCRPLQSDAINAVFYFNVNSCGTTRRFDNNHLTCENEVLFTSYLLRVACHYLVNDTKVVQFLYQNNPAPVVQPGLGDLVVIMRLALDSTYNDFYGAQDYPVVKYLRRPLYFEVELYSRYPQAELFLENCWATYSADGNSSPKWDVVVDNCENSADEYLTIFHPVSSNARVLFPSHLKRFEVKMFSFTSGREALKGQVKWSVDSTYNDFYGAQDYPVVKYLRRPLYFEVELFSRYPQAELFLENCWATYSADRNSSPKWDVVVDSVVICDSNRPSDSLCSRRCIPGKQRLGRSAEGMDGGAVKAFVSSGPIELKRDGFLRFMPRSGNMRDVNNIAVLCKVHLDLLCIPLTIFLSLAAQFNVWSLLGAAMDIRVGYLGSQRNSSVSPTTTDNASRDDRRCHDNP